MSRTQTMGSALVALALLGCGDSGGGTTPPIDEPDPPICAQDELELPSGGCIRPGMVAEDCAEGFVLSEAATCEPVLPAGPCPPGLMGVPGDAACRPVSPCGEGRWGEIPVDANTIFVDGAYAGDDSDGTEDRPFTSPLAAIAAAPPGALIAITDGVYGGYFKIEDKPLTLWGRCPERVELTGGATAITTASVYPGASGTVIRGVGITGLEVGVIVTGAVDVQLRDLWVHDVGSYGVLIDSQLGPTAAAIETSLIERSTQNALFVYGADASIGGTEIRETALASDGSRGQGVSIRPCDTTETCSKEVTLEVASSVIDGSHEMGIVATGATVDVDGSVIRNTVPSSATQERGHGLHLSACTASSCGVVIPSQGSIRRTLFQNNHEAGVAIGSSIVDVEAIVVRGTLPPAGNPLLGRGLNVEKSCNDAECIDHPPAAVSVSRSVFEDNVNANVYVGGTSALTFERSIVRRTYQVGEPISVALTAQPTCPEGLCTEGALTVATVRESLIEESVNYGVLATAANLELIDSVVRATWGVDGIDGDGVAAAGLGSAHTLALRNTLIDDSARAGLAVFGSHVTLEATRIRCADIAINTEDVSGVTMLEDLGANVCGCPDAVDQCKPLSAGLAPPGAL